jgi:rubrerythrin
MADTFNADEIFEIARQIERNGAQFYHKAAENTLSKSADKIFLQLAAMEEDHERTFATLQKELSKPQWRSQMASPDSEVELYLHAFANGHVFSLKANPAEQLAGTNSISDILRLAIKLEQDSIAFYLGMKDWVPVKLGKDRLDAIIKQEQSHIVLLSKELANVQSPNLKNVG